jgi:hypothetical protein
MILIASEKVEHSVTITVLGSETTDYGEHKLVRLALHHCGTLLSVLACFWIGLLLHRQVRIGSSRQFGERKEF